MSTLEQQIVGPKVGHSNSKALIALCLGIFAITNVAAYLGAIGWIDVRRGVMMD